MAKFAIYNYQFEPMLEKFEQMELEFPEWEKVDPKVSFENRQQIFGQIFEDDFNKVEGRTLKFKMRNKILRHDHLMKPTDGIIVMRVANQRITKITKADFTTDVVDDYPNCLVVFDNRDGIQRLLIEQKSSAFAETKTVAKAMKDAFNHVLKHFKLSISLDPIFRAKEFDKMVKQYDHIGFRLVKFVLPHKNLDRVVEGMEQTLSDIRANWQTTMEIAFKAPQGGRVPIDLTNERQMNLVKLASGIGGDTIRMTPNGQYQRQLFCGEDSFITENIESDIFTELAKENPINSLFEEDSPLNRLKIAMKQIKNHYD